MVRKVIQDEEILALLHEKTMLTRRDFEKAFPGKDRATLLRRIESLRKKEAVVSFDDERKENEKKESDKRITTYYVPTSLIQKDPEEAVKILPLKRVYDIAQYLFLDRDLDRIGAITHVSKPFVQAIHAFLQKKGLVDKSSFVEAFPLPETDEQIYTYLKDHKHAARSVIQKDLNIKKMELEESLERLGYFTDIFFVYNHDERTRHYFSPDYFTNITDINEFKTRIGKRNALRLNEILDTRAMGWRSLTEAMGFDTDSSITREYNNLSPLYNFIHRKIEAGGEDEEKEEMVLVPNKSTQLPTEGLFVKNLAERLSGQYYLPKDLLKEANKLKKEMGLKNKLDLEEIVTHLESQGYALEKRGGLYTTPRPAKKKQPRAKVYMLSEVGWDTAYFNPEAYDTLIQFMSKDETISGIIIDGALTRLDRPEFLNEDLTYWTRSEEECRKATEEIPNKEQYKTMLGIQFRILEARLAELRKRVPNAKEVVLYMESDDLQYTASAILNESLIRKKGSLDETIKGLKTEKKRINKEFKAKQEEYKKSPDAPTTSARELEDYQRRVEGLEETLEDAQQEKLLYREKKVRPAHQYITQQFVRELTKQYRDVCEKTGVKLVTRRSVFNFDGLTIDYAHSRHPTWGVIRGRNKGLLNLTHGKLMEAFAEGLPSLRETIEQSIDVIAESGHHGIGYKQTQSIMNHPDATNFKNQSLYDPKIDGRTITLVMALPFEDQKRIARFMDGKQQERLGLAKPVATRRHAVIDRAKNDSVSGVTAITKDSEGVIGTEWIQYANFSNGTALEQPKEYTEIFATSDEHIGSPEMNWTVLDGAHAVYRRHLVEPRIFRGKPIYTRGYISGGDTAEANSRRWNFRSHYRRSPKEVLQENLKLLSSFKPNSLEAVVETVMKFTNDARGGSVEDMSVILNWVADYYKGFLEPTLKHSKLQRAHISVPGNHADGVLFDLGLKESDYFEQWARGKGFPIYKVGEPDYFQKEIIRKARIILGGYSPARIVNLEEYGFDVNGEPLFGPINLVVHHDPKGSGFNGLIGAGKKAGADLALAGHTHENWVSPYSIGHNKFSVAYRLSTMQGVTSTELVYAESVPRTQAAHRFVMPMPGHFAEETLPAAYLKAEAQREFHDEIKWNLAQKEKS